MREKYIAAIRKAAAAGDFDSANELAEYVSANMPTAAEIRQRDFESMPWYQQAGIGAGQSVADVFTGAKALLGGDTAQAERDSQMLDDIDSGWKTAGNIAADIGMTALPGSFAAAGATRAGLSTGARIASTLAAEGVGAGVVEGLQEQDFDKGLRAGGMTAAGGYVLPKLLGVGTRAGPDILAAQGVNLTPGQRWGGLPAMVEEILSYIPGTAKPVQAARERAVQSWNSVLRSSMAPTATKGMSPHEATQAIKTAVKSEYDDIFRGTMTLDGLDNAWMGISAGQRNILPPDELSRFNKTLENYWQKLEGATVNGKTVQTADKALGKLANQAYKAGDGLMGDAYSAAQRGLQSALPKEIAERLAVNAKAYGRFKVLESATGKVAPSGRSPAGTIMPQELVSSTSAGRRGQAAVGRAPLQDEAHMAAQTLSRPDNAVQGLAQVVPGAGSLFINPVTQRLGNNSVIGQAGRLGLTETLRAAQGDGRVDMNALYQDMLNYRDPDDPMDQQRIIADQLRRGQR